MKNIDISVCIVAYQSKVLLENCLDSLYRNTASETEVIVVDNGSTDGTPQMLKERFPRVQLVVNPANQGYTKPMNRALRLGQGRYLLQLNPDTLILPGALDEMRHFMDSDPQIGICGPKVLNRDHTIQAQCRRGESRPWAVISYFTGLSTLFPRSKFFGQYLMSYKAEDEIHPAAGVSGSCMMARREMIDQIGYLDERFFAFQEDSDFCLRARRAGWQVYYYPKAEIEHYGSMGGSHVHPYRSIYEWHRSYFLFYRKNFASDYFFLFNWLYYLAMLVKFILTVSVNFFRKGFFIGSRRSQAPKEF